jgi:hypothetical protein
VTTVEVLGRDVALPVHVRTARSAAATFLVRHDAVARLMDGTGLEPARLPGGRALCILAVVDYIDNDLGAYHEVGVCFGVGKDGDVPPGAYIHQLPVDGEFTCAAGRGIWGFPKWIARIDLDWSGGGVHARLVDGDELVLDLTVKRRRLPLPGKGGEMTAYAAADGTTRRTPFGMEPSGVKGGPFGGRLLLGERHPMAQDLRSLGLPKRPIATSVIGNLAATFGEAVKV